MNAKSMLTRITIIALLLCAFRDAVAADAPTRSSANGPSPSARAAPGGWA